MNKQVFFKKLRRGLRWTFTEEEIADILTDYEGFFASGNTEGKEEGRICAELGDPADIARELAVELEKKRTSPLWIKIFARMFFSIFVGFAGYLIGGYILWRTGFFHGNILLYATLVVVMWLLLIGFTRKPPAVAPASQRIWKRFLIACHAVISGTIIVDYAFCYNALSSNLHEQSVSPPIFSSYFFHFEPIIRFIPLLIAVMSVYGFYRANPQWFTVISHALGASVFLWTSENILGNISSPEDLNKIPYTLIVYGVSLVVTALLAVFIRKGSGRRA